MYLLDPEGGRRRRHEILRRTGRAGRGTAEGFGRAARDLGNRTRALFGACRRLFRREEATGERLAARVRSRLGRVVSHPRAIDVSVEDGRVVLAGPILSAEAERAVEEAARVRGVEHVDNQMDVFEVPGDIPALEGGLTRTGPRSELMQESWTPGVRVLAAVGSAVVLAVVGAAVAAALGNRPLAQVVGLRR
jgi:hypothetical protein